MSSVGIGKRSRKGNATKKKKKKGGDDLHDFIHDIEFSAKKILKQHMQKRLTEATLERREKRRAATGLLPPSGKTMNSSQQMGYSGQGGMTQTGAGMPSPGMASTYGGPATDSPGAYSSTMSSTQSSYGGGSTMGGIAMSPSNSMGMSASQGSLPTIGSGMSASLLSGGGSGNFGASGSGGGNGSSLPRLSATHNTSPERRRKRLTAADKQKLKASPFARTRRSVDEEEAINGRSGVKTDKSVGMTGGKMLKEAAKLASATIKGDVHALSMLRADHAVDRKMSAQAWADPNSKTGVEKGMSTLGLVLDRAHELQGPTGWASDDLRRKYRDESERLNAYEAGVQAKKEAERLEREQNIIRSFVEIPMHPLHMYFVDMCKGENEKSKRRARSRNQLKTFSLDLITLWHANRPDNEGTLNAAATGAEGQMARIKGLINRRPGHAIKAFNAQVQSVSIERAMQGSMSSSQLHLMGKFGGGGAHGGSSDGGGGPEGLVTQSEKDAADAEATRQRRMMWQRPWFRSVAHLPVLEDGPPGEVEKLLDLTWNVDVGRHQNEKLINTKKKEQWSVEEVNVNGFESESERKSENENSSSSSNNSNNEGKSQIENPEESTNGVGNQVEMDETPQYAPAGVSVFRRGRGDLRRLVIHVHDASETTASALQISEKVADSYLQQYAVGRLKRQRAKEKKEYLRYEKLMNKKIQQEKDRWTKRCARREANAIARTERRLKEMATASQAEFTTAAEFGCNIQGKYVLMTIDVAVSSETCVPNAACLRCQAYDPLDCTTTIIDVLGVDLLKTLSVDVANNVKYPSNGLPVYNSEEETKQWEDHNERFTLYIDEDSEEVRVRALHWIQDKDDAKMVRCTYKDVTDPSTLPIKIRMSLAKQASQFWSDYYGRLPLLRALIARLSWARSVDEEGKTVENSVSLNYQMPDSVGDPRFEKETVLHNSALEKFYNMIQIEKNILEFNENNNAEQEEEAASNILTPNEKQQGLLRLLTLSPAPEPSEEDMDGPGAQWADQLVASLITDEYMAEGQSSVRGRDEAEEWAAAQEAAREEQRHNLAMATMSYVVCGDHDRFGKVPGVSITGYMDVVSLFFCRDAERSSTNSVLVTVCTALENALLCPMLGGYDTIVEVADHAPEEAVGGPITTLVPPSSCRQATTTLNGRLPHTCIVFNDSAEPLDHFVESNYPGHRRNEPPRHKTRGFARYSMQRLLVPNPIVEETSFGVTERAAVANAPGCWPRRHTWHSEEVANGNLSRVRRQSDYAYVSQRKFASGSNDPNIYVAHMDTYKVGQLEMRKLSWFLRDERNRIANAKKEEEDSAMQARIEAGKAMAAQRESDRLEMERQQHYTELRTKRRQRGKGNGAGSEKADWKTRRDRSDIVGVSGGEENGSGFWLAYLDKSVGVEGGGGTIFYHNNDKEEREGIGSTWDRPIEWEGVVGGPDMMKKVDDWMIERGMKKAADGEKEDTPRTKENKLGEARLQKIETEKNRRVEEKEREKREHYLQVVSRVRRFINERARMPGDRYDLRRPFDNFDADGQGSIDREEFEQVLELLFVGEEIDFWPDEVDRLMSIFDDTKDGFITFGKFVRFAMGENEDHGLIADGEDSLGQRVRKLLEKIYEWTEDWDPNTEKKYWYNPASASSVYECPESLSAAVKALEAEKALIDSQKREKIAVHKQQKAEAKAKKHMQELPKTMNDFVAALGGNSEFVDMLAKQLGLERSDKSKNDQLVKDRAESTKKNSKKSNVMLREQQRLEGGGKYISIYQSTKSSTCYFLLFSNFSHFFNIFFYFFLNTFFFHCRYGRKE